MVNQDMQTASIKASFVQAAVATLKGEPLVRVHDLRLGWREAK